MERDTSTIILPKSEAEITHYTEAVVGDSRKTTAIVLKGIGEVNPAELEDMENGDIKIDMAKFDTVEMKNVQILCCIKEIKYKDKSIKGEAIVSFYDSLSIEDGKVIDNLVDTYISKGSTDSISKK